MGWNDPTAFVIAAYRPGDPTLYFIDTYKKSGMYLTDVIEQTEVFKAKYNPSYMIIDNASKQAVEEMMMRSSLPFIATEKTNKRDFIQLMNTDLYTGNVKVLPKCADLVNEWEALVWDERQLDLGKYVEHPALPNHLCDAALYSWRYAYHYTAKAKVFKPHTDPNDKYWEDQELKIIKKNDHEEEELDIWN